MKVLVIGGGGREHAVCKKLSESKDVTEILCAPGNAGIAQVARCIPEVKATDIEGIVALAQREKVDFVCVTPDDPLALGCVDKLEAAGIPAFGQTAYAAQMEASKIFSKNLMRKYGIPTAKSETFTEMDKALAYLDTLGGEGIREAAAQAVLNANYLMRLLRDGGYPMAYDHPCMHEFVITLEKLKHEKDVSALDVAKALLDHGMHPPTMYFPLIVHEALMVEPTETESKESLEAAAESYLAVLAEANENPADMHNRPLTTYVRRLDEVTAARNPIVKYEAPSA